MQARYDMIYSTEKGMAVKKEPKKEGRRDEKRAKRE